MGWYAKERAAERIARAAGAGLDLVGFWREASEAVGGAIPHYMAPCWFTLDPASLLVTSHYDHDEIPELPSEGLAHEFYEDDFHGRRPVRSALSRSAEGRSASQRSTRDR